MHVLTLFSNTPSRSLRIKLRMLKDGMELKKRKINLPDQAKMLSVKASETDFSALHSKLEVSVKEGTDEDK